MFHAQTFANRLLHCAIFLCAFSLLSGCEGAKQTPKEPPYIFQPIAVQSIPLHEEHVWLKTPPIPSLTQEYVYRLGPQDIISVRVWKNGNATAFTAPDYAIERLILNDSGVVLLPEVDSVVLRGLTQEEARTHIAQQYRVFHADAQAEVSVLAYDSHKAYLTGELQFPKVLELSNEPLALTRALELSGGIKQSADLKNAFIVRNGQMYHFNMIPLIYENDYTHNYTLQSGDTVHVPKNKDQLGYLLGNAVQPRIFYIQNKNPSLKDLIGNSVSTQNGLHIYLIRGALLQTVRKPGEPELYSASNPPPKPVIHYLNSTTADYSMVVYNLFLQTQDVVYASTTPVENLEELLASLPQQLPKEIVTPPAVKFMDAPSR